MSILARSLLKARNVSSENTNQVLQATQFTVQTSSSDNPLTYYRTTDFNFTPAKSLNNDSIYIGMRIKYDPYWRNDLCIGAIQIIEEYDASGDVVYARVPSTSTEFNLFSTRWSITDQRTLTNPLDEVITYYVDTFTENGKWNEKSGAHASTRTGTSYGLNDKYGNISDSDFTKLPTGGSQIPAGDHSTSLRHWYLESSFSGTTPNSDWRGWFRTTNVSNVTSGQPYTLRIAYNLTTNTTTGEANFGNPIYVYIDDR